MLSVALVLERSVLDNRSVGFDMIGANSDMFDFTLIVAEGSLGTAVAATLDILRTAELLAPRVGAPAPRWRVCSIRGGMVRLPLGMMIETTRLEDGPPDQSAWILPGFGLNHARQAMEFLARDDAQLLSIACRQHVAQGGRIAAGCSAVFLLNHAGLIDKRLVTTTWWLAPALQQMNAHCRVDASQLVREDGPIVTAGAAFAHTDLMLHLIRANGGARLTELICQYLILDSRQAQSPYVIPEVLARGDELVSRLVARIEGALPEVPSVAELAAHFCVSERTLARHVFKATGKTTLALIQSIRVRTARGLLERSGMSVDQVAEAVGYGDATALRRLMRKATGANPSRYRPGHVAPAVSRQESA